MKVMFIIILLLLLLLLLLLYLGISGKNTIPMISATANTHWRPSAIRQPKLTVCTATLTQKLT